MSARFDSFHTSYIMHIIGAVSVCVGMVLPFRTIRSVVLMRNGRDVTIVTHAALMRPKSICVPITKVCNFLTNVYLDKV